MRFLCCAVLTFSAMAISCGLDADPCAGISCSGHGVCSAAGNSAACRCEAGYREYELECLVDANPCAGVLCSGHGVCLATGNLAVCRCEAGYREQSLECLVDSDPCAGVLCSGQGVCSVVGNTAACTCDSGYVASGLACVPATASSTAGSCTMARAVAGGSRIVCLDMIGSEYTPTNVEAACQTTNVGAKPFSSGHCSTQHCIGACRISTGTSSEHVSYYYDDSSDPNAPKAECATNGGLWFVP